MKLSILFNIFKVISLELYLFFDDGIFQDLLLLFACCFSFYYVRYYYSTSNSSTKCCLKELFSTIIKLSFAHRDNYTLKCKIEYLQYYKNSKDF